MSKAATTTTRPVRALIPEKDGKAKAKQTTITLQPPRIEVVHVTVRGTTPLLIDRLGEWALPGGTRRKQTPPSDAAVFNRARYHWQGKDWIKSAAFKEAMVAAGSHYTTHKRGYLEGLISFTSEYLEIRGDKPVPHETIGRNSGINHAPRKVIRPMYKRWRVDMTVRVIEPLVARDIVALLLIAGVQVGVGSWRPAKRGTFGQFEVAP